jgi:glucuronate isomerase
VPTFRADAYLDPQHPGFTDAAVALAERFGTAPDDLDAHLEGLAARRADFRAVGAVSADHGVVSPYTVELERDEARRLFRRAVRGDADARAARALAGHLLLWSAAQSVRDGLVMTIHAGVLRDHSSAIHDVLGRDAGYDIPVATEFTHNLRPLLERFGHAPGFHLVLFTVDETTWSRELAPLAGAYPSVYIGAPWWFLDAPDAARRFRAATAESAGLLRGSGFIDDTRALTSIPARHDMARRLDAAYLATLVVEGRIGMRMAERLAHELTLELPRRVFKL